MTRVDPTSALNVVKSVLNPYFSIFNLFPPCCFPPLSSGSSCIKMGRRSHSAFPLALTGHSCSCGRLPVLWLQPCLLALWIYTAASSTQEISSLWLLCRQPSPSPRRIAGFAACCRRLGSKLGEFRTGRNFGKSVCAAPARRWGSAAITLHVTPPPSNERHVEEPASGVTQRGNLYWSPDSK